RDPLAGSADGPHDRVAVQRLAIVGTGLIGASVGLAARAAGVAEVRGWDVDPDALQVAAGRGAGEPGGALARGGAGAAGRGGGGAGGRGGRGRRGARRAASRRGWGGPLRER